MKCVFVDIETTGLDPKTCEIVELAVLPWNDGNKSAVASEKFRALGNPETENFKGAAKVNGYTEESRKGSVALTFRHVAGLLKMIADADGYIVGCNPSFDWDFIKEAATRLGVPMPLDSEGKPLRIRLIDVASMAVPLLVAGKIKSIRLRDMAALVGKAQTDPHSAADDVALTCEVFEKLFFLYYGALK